jgi:hypothetical protein
MTGATKVKPTLKIGYFFVFSKEGAAAHAGIPCPCAEIFTSTLLQLSSIVPLTISIESCEICLRFRPLQNLKPRKTKGKIPNEKNSDPS